jgi:glyoxylase-like metal-dependent hydrolase (beta-lactamase superfamily II)
MQERFTAKPRARDQARHLACRSDVMDKVPIPENEIVDLDVIAPDVHGLRIGFVNVFAVGTKNGGWCLIDAGLGFAAGRIRRWAQEHFGPVAPAAILLTHGHFDHVGALDSLLKEWTAPVYAHALEMPYLTGKEKYPPPDPGAGGGLMALMSPLYSRGPIDLGGRVRMLPDQGSVPALDGWRWIFTPGHTPGHVSFFRHSDRTLLAGDALTTTKAESLTGVVTQKAELHGPPSYYTPDWDAAKLSVEKLAELEPTTLAAGHGPSLSGPDVAYRLHELADHFDAIARPEKYRRDPAA